MPKRAKVGDVVTWPYTCPTCGAPDSRSCTVVEILDGPVGQEVVVEYERPSFPTDPGRSRMSPLELKEYA